MAHRSHRATALVAAGICCALLALPASSSAIVRGILPNCKVAAAAASAIPRHAPTVQLGRAAICLLNKKRSARGMARLRINPRLSRAARRHTRDMVRRHYFGHTSPRGGDVTARIRRTGYLNGHFSWSIAENIAWGTRRLGSPRAIVRAWMHSPGHRHNILNAAYREIGIGVVAAAPSHRGTASATYTTTFGARR
jgi:uncharacterized protein YkwD